jgi:hypothetical protein
VHPQGVSFGTYEAKHPGETLVVEFEWFALLASFWRPGKVYAVSDYVQPRTATGFAYQRTTGTKSGAQEPAWPRTLSAVVVDGDGTWTAVASSAGGVQAASSPTVIESSGELTIASVSVVNGEGANTRVRATISGGQDGKTYRVRCTITAGAQVLVGTLLMPVSVQV